MKSQPQKMTPEQAAQVLLDRKHITVLTGAGISAASGIPTFRGNEGFWKSQKKVYCGETDPSDICRRTFFDVNPMANWEWHYDFIKLASDKVSNAGHKAIVKFQEYCAQAPDMSSMLVTQNIDNLHAFEIKKSSILTQS